MPPYSQGRWIIYKCFRGFQMTLGSEKKLCMDDKRWQDDDIICTSMGFFYCPKMNENSSLFFHSQNCQNLSLRILWMIIPRLRITPGGNWFSSLGASLSPICRQTTTRLDWAASDFVWFLWSCFCALIFHITERIIKGCLKETSRAIGDIYEGKHIQPLDEQ